MMGPIESITSTVEVSTTASGPELFAVVGCSVGIGICIAWIASMLAPRWVARCSPRIEATVGSSGEHDVEDDVEEEGPEEPGAEFRYPGRESGSGPETMRDRIEQYREGEDAETYGWG